MTLSSLGVLSLFLIVSFFPTSALAQANFTAQVRGVVQDSTNAAVALLVYAVGFLASSKLSH